MGRSKSLLVASLPLAGLLGVVFFLDWIGAASLNHPFVGAVATLGVLAAVVLSFTSRRAWCLLSLIPFAAGLMLLPRIDTSPLKPFGRFYAALETGMTEAEALQTLDAQFPPTSRYSRPFVNRRFGANHLAFILDPKDGRYDAEIVDLDFQDGRVVGKRYWPD